MNRRQVEAISRRLKTKEQELVATISRIELDGRAVEGLATQDLGDRANHSYVKEALFQRSSTERTLLTLVQGALRRAEEGHYGRCVECGLRVETKRLAAVPWARHCMVCQEMQEQGLL